MTAACGPPGVLCRYVVLLAHARLPRPLRCAPDVHEAVSALVLDRPHQLVLSPRLYQRVLLFPEQMWHGRAPVSVPVQMWAAVAGPSRGADVVWVGAPPFSGCARTTRRRTTKAARRSQTH